MLDDIALFVRVVAYGGLNKAAEHLELPPATVTRRLQRLERQMGSKLLHRSTHRFDLTEVGQKLLDECGFLVESLVDRAAILRQSHKTLSGNIRVMGPVHLMTGSLGHVWAKFLTKYPEVSIEFLLSNSVDDFNASRADFAIRVSSSPLEDMYFEQIGGIPTVIVAAKSYLQKVGEVRTPNDLQNCDFVVGQLSRIWKLRHRQTGERFDFHVQSPRVLTNDLTLVRQQCHEGIGLTLLPYTEVFKDISEGNLVHVLPEWQGQFRNVYLARGRDVPPTLRAKRLMEHVRNAVEEIPELQGILHP